MDRRTDEQTDENGRPIVLYSWYREMSRKYKSSKSDSPDYNISLAYGHEKTKNLPKKKNLRYVF